MKKLMLLVFVLSYILSNAQTKKMQQQIDSCKIVIQDQSIKIREMEIKVNQLFNILTAIKNDINFVDIKTENNILDQPNTLKEENIKSDQCKAITAAGKRCSRMAQLGSDYCWQHNKTTITTTKSSSTSESNSSGSRTIQTGPRGGQYYINSHGNKTYIKRK